MKIANILTMSNLKNLLCLCVLIGICRCSSPPGMQWVSSSAIGYWQQRDASIVSSTETDSVIVINTQAKKQTISGFGGCFNEMGWEALKAVSDADRDAVIKSLFDSLSGCKFNLCRLPIGANDYALDWYSHNETVGDFEMKNFSIDRDRLRLIPYIKAAQAVSPKMKLWASPWCPPSWMKKNQHYACYPTKTNGLAKDGEGVEMQDQFIAEGKYFDAYALYFEKFVKAYEQEGISLYAIHTQNEPNSCQGFPSCIWKPSTMARFISNYLGPKFHAAGLTTEIWLGTIERPQPERVDTILSDESAKKYIRGVGFQWAGKDVIPHVYKTYPQLQLMQTETECGDGSNDWKAVAHTFGLMKHYFNNGANAYMYWNMVLDETGKSQWGWKQNSMISIDTKSHTLKYNPEYYLMKHFSHYVKPGAIALELADQSVPALAFLQDKHVVVVYYNQASPKSISLQVNGKVYTMPLDAESINTFLVAVD